MSVFYLHYLHLRDFFPLFLFCFVLFMVSLAKSREKFSYLLEEGS